MLDLFQSGSLSELMHGNNIRSRFRHRLVCVLAQADLLARALRQGNPNNSKFHEPGILKLKSAADTAPCDMLRAGTPKDGFAVKSSFAADKFNRLRRDVPRLAIVIAFVNVHRVR